MYDHPSLKPLLEPVLRETLGIVLFQDQVQQVAVAVAGFSEGGADAFRRAMSRKRSRAAMLALWAEFRDGALKKGIPRPAIVSTFKKLLGFAEYGFPKAHAAAFAVLAYQSAWLKRYYPVEFLCALLNNQPMGFYPPAVLLGDARRHGVAVLGPDLNRSAALCTIEDGAVRTGLSFAQGISKAVAERAVEERQQGGPYLTLWETVRRSGLRREALEGLIQVGALDGFGLERRELLWQLGLLWRPSGKQLALPLPVEQDMVRLRAMSPWERMAADYAVLGMSPQDHPMRFLRPGLPGPVRPSRDVADAPDGLRIMTAGLVACRQRPGTAKGFLFLTLEDEFGLTNVIVRPDLYNKVRVIVRSEPFLLVTGRLQRQEGVVNVLAEAVSVVPKPLALVTPETHSFR